MRKSAPVISGIAVLGLFTLAPLAAPPTASSAQATADRESSLLDLARRAATEGRAREALEILDRALSAGRRSAELYDLRGQFHLALGDTPAAERDWRRAAELDPANAGARTALGRLYLQRGLWGDAIRIYREVLLRNSRNVDALLGLSDALGRMGRTVGSRRLIEAAGQAIDDPRIQQRWAQVALESGQPDEAESALKRIADRLDGSAKRDVMVRLAELYVAEGRYDEAVAVLQQAQAIGGAPQAATTETYDLLVEATDNLVRRRVSALEETLQQLDASSLSREEALARAERTRMQLTEIDRLVEQIAVPDSRKQRHATRMYAYSLVNEAAFNALAYIDLGLPGKRDAFAARWRTAQAEMAQLGGPHAAGR